MTRLRHNLLSYSNIRRISRCWQLQALICLFQVVKRYILDPIQLKEWYSGSTNSIGLEIVSCRRLCCVILHSNWFNLSLWHVSNCWRLQRCFGFYLFAWWADGNPVWSIFTVETRVSHCEQSCWHLRKHGRHSWDIFGPESCKGLSNNSHVLYSVHETISSQPSTTIAAGRVLQT